MKLDVEKLKQLREMTGAGVADCRMALEETNGDLKAAAEVLRKKGIQKAEKKAERQVKAGKVFSYIHHTGRVGCLVALACETDFVAKTEQFEKLGKELTLQIVSTNPENVEELLKQDYIRDGSKTIQDLVKETVGVLGENIQVMEFKIATV